MKCNFQQKAFVSCEELNESILVMTRDKKDLICPKPLRVGLVANNFIKMQRLHRNQAAGTSDSKAGAELLDIILRKEDCGIGEAHNLAISLSPFYIGCPPTRASNPLVQDAHFGDMKLFPPLSPLHFHISPSSGGFPSASSASHSKKRDCFRSLEPAKVRVEGFDCLNRDRHNSRVPATA